MTFIAGFRCSDGLVIAADSQEGDGFTKRSVNKLEVFSGPTWGLCWGCSGNDARVVDKFSDRLSQALEKVKSHDRIDVEAQIETCLGWISKRYQKSFGIEIIAGLYGPPRTERGKNVGSNFFLYRGSSQDECVSKQRTYCFTGTGDNSLAHFIVGNSVNDLDWIALRVFQAKLLAVWVTSLMKEYADGVGGSIRVRSYEESLGKWSALVPHLIKQIENEFPPEEVEEEIFSYWSKKHLKHFRQWMDEVNQEEIKRERETRR